jgi:hypothetical protein
MTTTTLERPHIATPAEWLAARKALLKKEKELTRQKDALSAERRALPWVRVEKNYIFDAPGGKLSLAELFDGRSQLAVYHFMFGPDWAEGCPSCSMVADGFDGSIVHIAQRDVSFAAISRAPPRTNRELSSTPIPRLGEELKIFSPFTHSSIARPGDAMKPAFRFRWHGFATTIATRPATWQTRIGPTGPHLTRRILRRRSVLPPLPKQTLPAAPTKTTNPFSFFFHVALAFSQFSWIQ